MRKEIDDKAHMKPRTRAETAKLLTDVFGVPIKGPTCVRYSSFLSCPFHQKLLRRIYEHKMTDFLLMPRVMKRPGMLDLLLSFLC